jgi:hypothetical protein
LSIQGRRPKYSRDIVEVALARSLRPARISRGRRLSPFFPSTAGLLRAVRVPLEFRGAGSFALAFAPFYRLLEILKSLISKGFAARFNRGTVD